MITVQNRALKQLLWVGMGSISMFFAGLTSAYIGKDGGEKGGYVVANGTPEKLVKCKDSYTAKFLEKELS